MCNKHHYRTIAFTNDEGVHSKPRDVIDNIICKKFSDVNISKRDCVLKQFKNYPKCIIQEYEYVCTNVVR